jgi:NADH dehydrogenase/NADH:ubiquinone oxidoreductase subunit G
MDLDKVTTVPALSYYEEENLFVNLEGRPQKTLTGINGPESARSLRKVFAQLLDKKLYTSKSFNHIIELLSSFDLKTTSMFLLLIKKRLKQLLVLIH